MPSFGTSNDWRITAFRQVHIPPFKIYVAMGRKKFGDVEVIINAEGDSIDEAVRNLKQRLVERDGRS